jgi:hypothetical protein
MIPKVSRCTVDILSQILYDKTQDVGKNYVVKGSDSPVLSDTWEETYELLTSLVSFS